MRLDHNLSNAYSMVVHERISGSATPPAGISRPGRHLSLDILLSNPLTDGLCKT